MHDPAPTGLVRKDGKHRRLHAILNMFGPGHPWPLVCRLAAAKIDQSEKHRSSIRNTLQSRAFCSTDAKEFSIPQSFDMPHVIPASWLQPWLSPGPSEV